jgi:hypothetical protein
MTFEPRKPHFSPGATQLRILARAYEDGGFITVGTKGDIMSALKLHGHGLLDRHTKHATSFLCAWA